MPSKYIAFLPVQNFLRSRWSPEDDWLWKTAGVRKIGKIMIEDKILTVEYYLSALKGRFRTLLPLNVQFNGSKNINNMVRCNCCYLI